MARAGSRRPPQSVIPAPAAPPPRVWTVAPVGRPRRCGQTIATVDQLIRGRGDTRPIYTLPAFQRAHTWTIDQSATYLARTMAGLPGGTILVWERRDAVIVVDGQQRLTALGCDVRRADGTRNPTPALYLDLGAVAQGQICWTPERRAPDDPTAADLVDGEWTFAYYMAHEGDPVARDAMHRAHAALRSAELHVLTVGGWQGDTVADADVREIFAALNTGGTPMTAAEVAALIAPETTCS